MPAPRSRFRTLLVPYDGSRPAAAALAAALDLAGRSGGRLRGLFVVDQKVVGAHFFEDLAGAAGVGPFLGLEAQSRQALEQIGRALLAAFEKACRTRGVPAETALVEDTVAEGVLAASGRADLIVMGQRGARRGGVPLGSNVERVVRSSKVPVLVVPEGARPVRRILVGYDGSAHARQTLDLALAVRALLRAPLTVLRVATDLEDAGRLIDWKQVTALARARGARTAVRPGEPGAVLARIAKSREYDLLVLGAYGQGALKELLLGSTTDRVLRETRTPLLIYR